MAYIPLNPTLSPFGERNIHKPLRLWTAGIEGVPFQGSMFIPAFRVRHKVTSESDASLAFKRLPLPR